MSPDGAQDSPGTGGAPTSPTRAALSSNPTGVSSGLEPAESYRTSPMSPRSYGLRATSGYNLGEGSSLFDNPDFIQVMFYIGWFITTVVDTKAYRANTKAFYAALETASTHLNVSLLLTLSLYSHGTVLTFLCIQVLVKHSEAKGQFLRVAVKRMMET
jgi:hypothetical protein